MKRDRLLVSEDRVAPESHKVSNERLPTVGVYSPNYHAVNQMSAVSGGHGAINFMNTLGAMSAEAVAAQQNLYDRMEINDAVAQVDLAYKHEEAKFFNESPTGKGFLEFATGTYDALSSNAIANASRPELAQHMDMLFSARKKDIANNAFQKEREVYTGYAINAVETQLNATINEITNTPDQYDSLQSKFTSQVETMLPILPKADYDRYLQHQNQKFMEGYGLGLILKDPYKAQAQLKDEKFKILPPNRYAFLQNQAQREVQRREYQARKLANMQAQAEALTSLFAKQDMEFGIESGAVSEGDIEASNLPPKQKQQLKLKLEKYKKDTAEKDIAFAAIDYAIQNNISREEISVSQDTINSKYFDTFVKNLNESRELENKPKLTEEEKERYKNTYLLTNPFQITDDHLNKYLDHFFRSADERRIREGLQPMSIAEKVAFLQSNGKVFNKAYNPLKLQISTAIKYSDNAQDIFDACVAISGTHLPAIEGLDSNVRDFADFTAVYFRGTQDLAKIPEMRKLFVDTPKNDDATNKWWNGEKWHKTPYKTFYDFCENNGIDLDEHEWYQWSYWGDNPSVRRADVNEIRRRVSSVVERVAKQTGSVDWGETVASRYIKKLVKESDINGAKAYLINPPTEENTGFSAEQIKNVMYGVAKNTFDQKIKPSELIAYTKKLIDGSVKAGDPIINVVLDGKTVRRRLMFEAASLDEPIYDIYYLVDEKKEATKEFLTDQFGRRYSLDFRDIKAIFKKQNAN